MRHRPCGPVSAVLAGLLVLLLSAPVAGGAGWTWLVLDRVPDVFTAGASALLGAGSGPGDGVAAVSGDLVSLFGVGGDGRLILQGSFLTDASWSAVALGDVDADGRWEVVGARGEEGAVEVDRWVKGQRRPLGAPRYAWAQVKALQLASTGSGRVVVAALHTGGLVTHLIGGNGLEPAGTIAPHQRFSLFGAGDLDGDGQDELVAGADRRELVVFRWDAGSGWVRWWQNFPWGGLVAAAVDDLDGDGRPELLACSGEGLLYVFSRNAAGTGLSLRWQGAVACPLPVLGMVAVPGGPPAADGSPGFAAGVAIWGKDEVRLCYFDAELAGRAAMAYRVEGVAEVSALPPLSATGPAYPRLLVRFMNGSLATVGLIRSDRLRLFWAHADQGEVPVSGQLERAGRLYISVREVAAALGLTVDWDAERRVSRLKAASGRTVEVAPGQPVRVSGVEVSGVGRPLEEAGRLYLEARSVEALFPAEHPDAPHLLVRAGERRWPASDLW